MSGVSCHMTAQVLSVHDKRYVLHQVEIPASPEAPLRTDVGYMAVADSALLKT